MSGLQSTQHGTAWGHQELLSKEISNHERCLGHRAQASFLLPGRYFAQFRLKKPSYARAEKKRLITRSKDAGLKTPFSLKTGRDLFHGHIEYIFICIAIMNKNY